MFCDLRGKNKMRTIQVVLYVAIFIAISFSHYESGQALGKNGGRLFMS